MLNSVGCGVGLLYLCCCLCILCWLLIVVYSSLVVCCLVVGLVVGFCLRFLVRDCWDLPLGVCLLNIDVVRFN